VEFLLLILGILVILAGIGAASWLLVNAHRCP
jgi:hypothetical protein